MYAVPSSTDFAEILEDKGTWLLSRSWTILRRAFHRTRPFSLAAILTTHLEHAARVYADTN